MAIFILPPVTVPRIERRRYSLKTDTPQTAMGELVKFELFVKIFPS